MPYDNTYVYTCLNWENSIISGNFFRISIYNYIEDGPQLAVLHCASDTPGRPSLARAPPAISTGTAPRLPVLVPRPPGPHRRPVAPILISYRYCIMDRMSTPRGRYSQACCSPAKAPRAPRSPQTSAAARASVVRAPLRTKKQPFAHQL